jgi:outer membrane protein
MRRLASIITLAWMAAPLAAAEVVTLQGAAEMAMQRNPRLAAARAGTRIAGGAFTAARETWLPHVAVSETFTRGDNPVFVFGSLLEQGKFTAAHFDPASLNDPPAMDNSRLAVTARFPLFDGLRRVALVEQARLGTREADDALESAAQQIRFETIRRYYGVVVAEEAVKVAEEAVASAVADVAMLKERFAAGLVVQSDLLAAEVQLAEMRQQRVVASGEAAAARAALNATIGVPAIAELELNPAIPETNRASEPLEELLQQALARRAENRSSESGRRRAELEVRIGRGSYLPRIDTFASWGESSDSFAGSGGGDSMWGAAVSFDILSPGRRGRLQQAKARVELAEANQREIRSAVEVDVVSTFHRFTAAGERLSLSRAAVTGAEEAYRIVRERSREGLTTITEVLRAQAALVRAKTNLLAAQSDYQVGFADLQRSTGRLTDVSTFN